MESLENSQAQPDPENPWSEVDMEPNEIFIDLKTPEFTEKFRTQGEIWQQSKRVNAVHVTDEGLSAGEYDRLGVRWGEATFKDADGNDEPYEGWLIDTYVMRGKGDDRKAVFETTRRLQPGEWIVTNPKLHETDVDNNYAMSDAEFQRIYHTTDESGVYESSGKLVRMFQNDTGKSVEFDGPWGREKGDEECYFATPYDPEKPDEIPEKRYAISANDVRLTYKKLEAERQ